MTTRTTMRTLALFTSLGIATAAPSALACGVGWYPEVQMDYRVEGIASAERDLANGRTLAAAGKVIRMIPHIKSYVGASNDTIVNRSMRVLALAAVEFTGASPEAKRANVEWSLRALRALRKQRKDDVTLKTELAEALAALPEKRAKARKMLEKLAQKDLITTPEAYRALGRLRADAGDASGEAAALARCRAMASDASVCAPAPGPAGES